MRAKLLKFNTPVDETSNQIKVRSNWFNFTWKNQSHNG